MTPRGLGGQARAMVVAGQPVTIAIVPGLSVKAHAFVDESGLVNFELMADTPYGKVGAKFYADHATFEKMLAAAEENEILPRAKAAIEKATGQRLLLTR